MVIGKTNEERKLDWYKQLLKDMIPRKKFKILGWLDDGRFVFMQSVWAYRTAELQEIRGLPNEVLAGWWNYYLVEPNLPDYHKEQIARIASYVINKYHLTSFGNYNEPIH